MNNPLPSACVLLLLAMPGVYLLARAAVVRASDSRVVQRVTAPMVGIAALILAVHVTGRILESFVAGLVVGTLTLSGLGLVAFLWDRQRARISIGGSEVAAADGDQQPSEASPGSSVEKIRRFRWTMWVTAGLAVAVIAPMTLGWAFHDELLLTGHMSIAAQLQNDVYPPRHMSFPQFELRYHYGYSLLVAIVTALLRLPLEWALDFVTLAMWACLWCLLWVLGERAIGRGAGWMMAVTVSFGGGFAFLSASRELPLALILMGVATRDGVPLNPPMISYFFQHPWTLGLPLAVAVLLLLSEPKRSRAGYWLVGLLLTALFLCQYVLFLALIAAVAVAEPLRWMAARNRDSRQELSDDWRRVAVFPSLALGVFAVTRFLGGFSLPPPDGRSEILVDPWVGDTAAGSIAWSLETFGLLLPLGLLGSWRLGPIREVSFLLTAGGLVIINLLRYAHSWDISKFATVASFSLSLGSAALLWNWWSRHRGVRRWVSLLLLGAVSAAGLLYAGAFVFAVEGTELVLRAPAPLSAEDKRVLAWLRENAEPGEVVYMDSDRGPAYAQSGGVPQAWLDGMAARHGFSEMRIHRRSALLTAPPHEVEPYLRENIRWFVVRHDELMLEGIVRAWVRDDKARVVFTTSRLKLVRLLKTGRAREALPHPH